MIGKWKILTACLLASSVLSTAYASDVTCPKVASVKGAVKALNGVIRQSEEGFFVLSAQPAINESDLGWIIMAQAKANGFDAAYARGQSEVKAVSMAAMDKPVEMQGAYVCAYITSTGGMGVMAVAPQQQGIVFNPGKLNLDMLKNVK